MDPIAQLRDRLHQELEFRAAGELELTESQHRSLDNIDFVGTKTYFGSLIAVGLVSADGLGAHEIDDRFRRFRAFFDLLLEIGPTARGLVVENLTGRSGLLGFVFQSPPMAGQVEHIRGLKHGSAASLGYCVAWSLDITNRRIRKHRGLPLKTYPGKRFFLQTIEQLPG